LYQDSSFYDPCNIKYQSSGNCSAGTCDWNGLFSWIQGTSTSVAYSLFFSCGQCDLANVCFYSDVRLKSGVETLKNVLDSIMKIEAVEYDWNDKLNPTLLDYFRNQQKLHTIGLIAQNVRTYFPEAVQMNTDGYYSIDYHKLNAVLVEGIKEQQIFIEDIDKQLEYIESKIK
jgi:hypothetical protein